jgi:hypothetical protein
MYPDALGPVYASSGFCADAGAAAAMQNKKTPTLLDRCLAKIANPPGSEVDPEIALSI